MTDNKNAVKNLAEVICERSEVIAELIVACVSAVKTSSYVVTDASDTSKEGCDIANPVVSSEEVKPKKKKVSSTRKEREEAEVLPEEITEESLAEVSYNGLKKLAKDLGVSASGDRETLTANILASVSEDEVEEEEDSDEEVTSSEEEIEDAEFSEEEEDEDNEEEKDSLAEQIEQATKDMTVEELADLLVSYKLPAKGKRQALIDAIIKGVEDGIIEFNTGDDVDEEEDEEEEEIDDAETVEEEVDEEVDDSPRGKAVQDLKDSIEAEFEEGSISRKDLITYINKRMGTKNRMKTVDDADLLAKYCELQATLIDDEGDLHEEKEPYVLNGEYHCCGEALQKDEDGDLVCPICGTCYDGEE
jgi:hypothetical protein